MGNFQNTLKRVFLIFIICLTNKVVYTQVFDNLGGASQGGFSPATAFVFTTPEGINIEVSLWGYVQRPGLYKVPHTTDLISLISLAGGPKDNARLDDVRIIRNMYGQDSLQAKHSILRINIEEYIEGGDRTKVPTLKPGDTVILTGSAYTVFTQFMSVLRDIALVANTVLLVIQLSKRTD